MTAPGKRAIFLLKMNLTTCCIRTINFNVGMFCVLQGFDAASNAPPAYTETEAAKYDEPHNASSKDAGSDENAGVLPVHPPSYTTIAGELDVFPLNFASGGGTRVPCDTDISDP
jgi:hypothetical protein